MKKLFLNILAGIACFSPFVAFEAVIFFLMHKFVWSIPCTDSYIPILQFLATLAVIVPVFSLSFWVFMFCFSLFIIALR